jgi:drug efflux transport system permease protein
MFGRIRALLVKEFLAAVRDPRARFILIGPPVIQLVVFAFAATLEVKNVHIAIWNQDWGQYSRDLVQRFEGSPTFTSVTFLTGAPQVRHAIDNERDVMVMIIPPEFSANVADGRPASIQLLLDGRKSNAAQIVAGYAQSIIDGFNDDLAQRARAPPVATALVIRAWFNPNFESLWNTVPALVAILTALIGLVVTALSIARERELGTFEQLLVSPLQPTEILIGKTIPAVLIGMGEGTIIITVGVLVLGVPFTGSLPLLYAAMLFYIAAIVGVGLFISSFANTQQQAILGAFVFMVPAITLSGFATPIANMPHWLQVATDANPVRFFLVICKGVFLKDMPASLVFENVWPMAAIAAVTLTSATWLFRRRL